MTFTPILLDFDVSNGRFVALYSFDRSLLSISDRSAFFKRNYPSGGSMSDNVSTT